MNVWKLDSDLFLVDGICVSNDESHMLNSAKIEIFFAASLVIVIRK